MRTRTVLSVVALLAVLALAPVLAHQETHKGTVIALEKPGVRVDVLDPKTKKTTARLFEIDAETRILRGDTVLTLATAKIQQGEAIAVTVDHDIDEHLALVIRLGAAK